MRTIQIREYERTSRQRVIGHDFCIRNRVSSKADLDAADSFAAAAVTDEGVVQVWKHDG